MRSTSWRSITNLRSIWWKSSTRGVLKPPSWLPQRRPRSIPTPSSRHSLSRVRMAATSTRRAPRCAPNGTTALNNIQPSTSRESKKICKTSSTLLTSSGKIYMIKSKYLSRKIRRFCASAWWLKIPARRATWEALAIWMASKEGKSLLILTSILTCSEQSSQESNKLYSLRSADTSTLIWIHSRATSPALSKERKTCTMKSL